MRRLAAAVTAMAFAAVGPALGQPVMPPMPTAMPARGDTAPVDYADPARWMCRPGVDDGTCSANLDAMRVDAAGTRTPAPYVPAASPPVDCFFVYPTTSLDPTMFSDLAPDAEEKRTVHGQAARLGARCRLFVPIYHQLTMTALRWLSAHPADRTAGIDFDQPYRDIRAAWRAYLARDNRGRGVVLIGHSQGAALLKRLIAEEIDGKPAQKSLVAAYLAGNSDLTGASFASIKPCAGAAQTGCVVAWSSYVETDRGARLFGDARAARAKALCVNPAAIGGGRGMLDAYVSRPALAPESDPPYVEAVGKLSAECVADDQGAVLRVRVEPGKYADLMRLLLTRIGGSIGPGWGLHPLDVSLVQGNIIDLIGTQSAAWAARR